MNEETDKAIKKVLKGFFKEMNKWERQAAKTHKADLKDDDSVDVEELKKADKKLIDEIFAEYCTPKERKFGRLGMFQTPPSYSPKEEILEIKYPNAKKAEAETQQHTGMNNKNRYILFYKNDRWLIDYKESWSGYENKWTKAIL